MESVRGACLTTMTTQISINVNKVAITVYRDLCASVCRSGTTFILKPNLNYIYKRRLLLILFDRMYFYTKLAWWGQMQNNKLLFKKSVINYFQWGIHTRTF